MNSISETVDLTAGTALGNDIINLVLQSGPVAKIVLIILVLFSLASWGVMLDKWLQFRRNEKSSDLFLSLFKRSSSLDDVMQGLKSLNPDPLARIFLAGYRALQHKTTAGSSTAGGASKAARMKLIELAIDDAIMVEVQLLERRLQFLGTCGSVTPFIGLFGTVWGIINAFHRIGAAGSASIAAVAPGIAEALIATAAGLAAAIPAVMAFNYFLGRIRTSTVVMERFRTNLLASLE